MTPTRLEFHETAGSDGVVRLEIPLGQPQQRFRVVLVVEPESDGTEVNEWPPGFLEKLVGSWSDDFVEESEGPYEERESF